MRRLAALSCVLITAALAGCGGGSSDDHPASTRASAATTPTVGVATVTTPPVSPGKGGTATTTTKTGTSPVPTKRTKPPKLHIKPITLPKPSPPLKIELTPSAADRAAIATCEAQVHGASSLKAAQRAQLLSICQAVRAKDVADAAKGSARQRCERLIDSVTLGSAAHKQAAVRKACAQLAG